MAALSPICFLHLKIWSGIKFLLKKNTRINRAACVALVSRLAVDLKYAKKKN